MRSIFFAFSFLFSNLSFANNPNFTAAHFMQIQMNQARTVKELLEDSHLNLSQKNETLKYLKDKKIESEMIPLATVNGSVLTISKWNVTVDLKNFEKGEILVNSKKIQIESFNSVLQLEKVLNPPTAQWIDWVLKRAIAADKNESSFIMSVIVVVLLAILLPVIQRELTKKQHLPEYWMAEAMADGHISDYLCNGTQGVKQFKIGKKDPLSFQVQLVDQKPVSVSLKNHEGKACDFMTDGKLEVTNVRLKEWNCELKDSSSGALKKVFPFQQLDNCCKKSQCHESVLKAAKELSNPGMPISPVPPPKSKKDAKAAQ